MKKTILLLLTAFLTYNGYSQNKIFELNDTISSVLMPAFTFPSSITYEFIISDSLGMVASKKQGENWIVKDTARALNSLLYTIVKNSKEILNVYHQKDSSERELKTLLNAAIDFTNDVPPYWKENNNEFLHFIYLLRKYGIQVSVKKEEPVILKL
jgi:hypothetical protein